MTQTGLLMNHYVGSRFEFRILVIVICLLFVIWNLEFKIYPSIKLRFYKKLS